LGIFLFWNLKVDDLFPNCKLNGSRVLMKAINVVDRPLQSYQ
jgi:hypothetical protein